MQAIVCVSKSWGIGNEGDLLFRISADLRRFRALTTGKTVIYGYKTLLTFPHAQPLPNRRNIILSRRDITVPGAEIAHSPAEAAALAGEDDAFVIGGASVYVAMLPLCSRALVTRVDADAPADSFFPDLDRNPDWRLDAVSGPFTESGLTFDYAEYVCLPADGRA